MVTTEFTVETVPTPALILHDEIVNRNIEKLAAYGRQHGIGIRPHTKTHKSLEMARRQLNAGAIGLTVAKVGEAEVMSEVCDDITVAYPVVDAPRANRLAQLAAQGIRVRVALDGAYGLNVLNEAAVAQVAEIGVLVDLDVGFRRTGLQSPQAALELAQQVNQFSHLRLDGIFCYPGHIWASAEEQEPELKRIQEYLEDALELWSSAGLDARIVSGGSTPTCFQSHFIPALTEIRPGTSIYNDMNTVGAGFCEHEDCAARIVCTVVSGAVPGKLVIDGGTKTFTSDKNVKQPDSGHGYCVEYPMAKLVRLSEEHGEVDITECDRVPRVGERITIIPNHICPCVNLQDRAWLADSNGGLTALAIDARGMLV